MNVVATVQPVQPALALRDVSKIFASRPLLRLPWQRRTTDGAKRVLAVDNVSLSVDAGALQEQLQSLSHAQVVLDDEYLQARRGVLSVHGAFPAGRSR